MCDLMFIDFGYLGEFLDVDNWMYKNHYIILTESRFQCLVKTIGSTKYYRRSRKGKNERQAHSIIFVSLSITCIYLYRVLCRLQKIKLLKNIC